MSLTRFCAIAALILLIAMPRARSAEPAPGTTQPAQPDAKPRPLRPGDRLRVTVHDLVEKGKAVVFNRQVNREGQVSLPYVGRVQVSDLFPVMAQQQIIRAYQKAMVLRWPNVEVEIVGSGEPQPETPTIQQGDWLRLRMWDGDPPHETCYILRVGADDKIRFPGAGLLWLAGMKPSFAEESALRDLQKAGILLKGELTIEQISDAEAQAAPPEERIGQLALPAGPTTQPDSAPRELSAATGVKLLAMPWHGVSNAGLEVRFTTPLSVRYHAISRAEEILQYFAPVSRARIIWETMLPDGFYELDASGWNEASVFNKLAVSYAHAFDCSVSRERREVPVLLLQSDKAIADKSLHAEPGIINELRFAGGGDGPQTIKCTGDMDYFSAQLEERLGMPVLNQTGLAGRYSLEVVYRSDDLIQTLNQSLKPLGLSVTKERREIDCVVVKAGAPATQPAMLPAAPSPTSQPDR